MQRSYYLFRYTQGTTVQTVHTIFPNMEYFVESPKLQGPISNHLGMSCAEVNVSTGQLQEIFHLVWLHCVGPELIKGAILLSGACSK